MERTLGKLSRWLRILGFDAAEESSGAGREEDTAEAERVYLTRTLRAVRKHRSGNLIFIRTNDPWEQLREVIQTLSISREQIRPFTRCIRCNRETDAVGREEVRGKVPDHVWETLERFRSCARCGRIYWPGTHSQRVVEAIDGLFGKT